MRRYQSCVARVLAPVIIVVATLVPASAWGAALAPAPLEAPGAEPGRTVTLRGAPAGATRFTLTGHARPLSLRVVTRGRAGVTVRVPASAPLGAYRLRACAKRTCSVARRPFVVFARFDRPRPLRATVDVDTARSITTPVTAAVGGVVEATAADGTRFRLEVPARALLDDVEVRLTPLRSLRGLPRGATFAAGVRMEPEGLRFSKPATLTIASSRARGRADAGAFGSAGSGADLHMRDATATARTMTMRIDHFSTASRVQRVTTAVGRFMLYRTPSDRERAAENFATALMTAERAGELGLGAKTSGGILARETALFLRARDGIALAFERARADEATERYVILESLYWERQVQLLGIESDRLEAYAADFAKQREALLQRAVRRALKRCAESHDLFQAGVLLRLLRELQLRGSTAEAADLGDVLACLTFQLDGTFSFSWTTDQSKSYGGVTRAGRLRLDALPLPWDLGRKPLPGLAEAQKPLVWESFTVTLGDGTSCTPKATSVEQPVYVPRVGLPADFLERRIPGRALAPITLFIDPGIATASYACGSGDSATTITEGLHSRVFGDFHQAERVSDSSTYMLENGWVMEGGAVYGRYHFSGTRIDVDQYGNDESSTTDLVLRHTPPPPPQEPPPGASRYPYAPYVRPPR